MMFVSVASAQDAKTVIANATEGDGLHESQHDCIFGADVHEGAGLGQWMSPTKGWHQNTVRDFTRFIDYNAGTSQRTGLQNATRRSGDGTVARRRRTGSFASRSRQQNTANVAATGALGSTLDVTLSPPAFLKLAAAARQRDGEIQSMNGKKYTVVSFASDQKAPSGVATADGIHQQPEHAGEGRNGVRRRLPQTVTCSATSLSSRPTPTTRISAE